MGWRRTKKSTAVARQGNTSFPGHYISEMIPPPKKKTHSASFLTQASMSRMWLPMNQTRLEK